VAGIFKEAVLAILATIAKQECIRLSERAQVGLEACQSPEQTSGATNAAVRPERVRALRD
jgi:hypothetical protein